MPYAICRVSRIKSRAALNSAFRHNYRVDPSSVSNADPTKGIKELYAVPGGTYEAALDAKLAESPYYQGHNVKKGSVLVTIQQVAPWNKNIGSPDTAFLIAS